MGKGEGRITINDIFCVIIIINGSGDFENIKPCTKFSPNSLNAIPYCPDYKKELISVSLLSQQL